MKEWVNNWGFDCEFTLIRWLKHADDENAEKQKQRN